MAGMVCTGIYIMDNAEFYVEPACSFHDTEGYLGLAPQHCVMNSASFELCIEIGNS